MLSFVYDGDKLVSVSSKFISHAVNRNDMETLAKAQKIAADATALTGELHIATDAGEYQYPRYDVIRAPAVSDAVSYSFNGDTRPCGHIASVSKNLRLVTTTTGQKFYRRRETGSWIENGTWFLVGGHHNERNPEL